MKKQSIKGLAFIAIAGMSVASCDILKDLDYKVENDPLIGIVRFSKAHIESRISSVQEIVSNIDQYIGTVKQELHIVEQYFNNHLWLDCNLSPEIVDSLNESLKQAEKLLNRANKLVDGFGRLPLEKDPTIEIAELVSSDDPVEGELCD